MKVAIENAYVSEGNAYEIATEDGIGAAWDYYVDVEANNTRYRHKLSFSSGYDAEILLSKVEAAGEINPEYWVEIGFPSSYALGEVDEVSLMDDEERFHKGC